MNPTCVIVLGMHRSGTSSAAGTLNILGAHLGTNLIPANSHANPKGFWEHAAVADFDERTLKAVGSDWFDVASIPSDRLQGESVCRLRDELTQLLRREFGDASFWAVKDPRICRLLPLWREVLDVLPVYAKFLLVLRDPLEVAESLRRRDGLPIPYGLLLWIRYVLESERNTRSLPRALLTYEDLLSDWRSVFFRIADTLNLTLAIKDPDAAVRVNLFLERNLRHHRADSARQTDPISVLATKVYNEVLSKNVLALEALAIEAECAFTEFAPWTTHTTTLLRKVAEYSKMLEVQRYYTADLEADIRRIKNTKSWRFTSPFRVVRNYFVDFLHK